METTRKNAWLEQYSLKPLDEYERNKLIDGIRNRLNKYKLTQVWVIQRLADENIDTERCEYSSILAGTRRGGKADVIIYRSSALLDDYERRLG